VELPEVWLSVVVMGDDEQVVFEDVVVVGWAGCFIA